MPPHPATRIADCFIDLTDPRVHRSRRHELLDLLTIAICAVLSGADTFVDIANWGRAKQDWLTEWLALPNGIPAHDTFGRVFARLDPDQVQDGTHVLATSGVPGRRSVRASARCSPTWRPSTPRSPNTVRGGSVSGGSPRSRCPSGDPRSRHRTLRVDRHLM